MVIEMDRVPSQPVQDPPNLVQRQDWSLIQNVASFVFKWHPEFAPSYVAIMRGPELVVSFMTLAEMRQGALEAN
jgi:hypothetical protein